MADFTDMVCNYKRITPVMRIYEGGAQFQLTPAVALMGGYQHTGFEGRTWNLGSTGLLYLLQKATTLYVSGDYVHASSGADPVIGWRFPPRCQPSSLMYGLVFATPFDGRSNVDAT